MRDREHFLHMGLLKFAALLIDFSCVFSGGMASPAYEQRNGFARAIPWNSRMRLLVCHARMHGFFSIQFEHDEPAVIALPFCPDSFTYSVLFTRNH